MPAHANPPSVTTTRVLLGVTMAVAIALALVSWALKPRPVTEAVTVFGLPLLWWAIERQRGPAEPDRAAARLRLMHMGLTALVLLTVIDTGPELALYIGLLGESWTPVVQRVFGVSWGLVLLVFGNYAPKLWRVWTCGNADSPAALRSARLLGWTLALSGLTAVGIWLTLPEPVARIAMLVLTGAMVVTLMGGRTSTAAPQA